MITCFLSQVAGSRRHGDRKQASKIITSDKDGNIMSSANLPPWHVPRQVNYNGSEADYSSKSIPQLQAKTSLYHILNMHGS